MSVELVLCRLDTWRRSWLDVLRSWRICKEMMLYIIVRRRGGCILSECQQCIVRTMKRRWGNYFLSRHKTSIRSLASSTHTQQYTLQSVTQILYIVMYERRSEDPWLAGDLVWGVPQPLYWLPVPEKWHILSHFKASKSNAFLVKMYPLSGHTY